MPNKKLQAGHQLLGTISFPSGKVRISDPCYDKDTWCAGTLPVKKGKWTASMELKDEGSWGIRVASLMVEAIGASPIGDWIMADFEVGVDSGQAGIFDENHFRVDKDASGYKHKGEEVICEDEPWYSMCCDVTLTDHAGIIPFGVVSSSGLGDGGYDCMYRKDKSGKIVQIMIDYGLNGPEENDVDDDEEDNEEDA